MAKQPAPLSATRLEEPRSLDQFLAQVERRAYRTALISTKKPADALDIVQDAMLQLVQSYRHKTAGEWPLLFNRILHHKIMDWHRSQTKHKRWFWQPANPIDDDDLDNEIEKVPDEQSMNPLDFVERAADITMALAAIEALPLRQKQAFLLRAWEGFDVQETAQAMGCTEGSVKTHYFRATQTLRKVLLGVEQIVTSSGVN